MSEYLEKAKRYKKYHYTVLEKSEIDYLHQRCLEMLDKVIEILDRNKVPYFMCGGTLLGGVQSKGFIPWDDDIDMCVMEEDYERMTNCLVDELPIDMVFQCKKTEEKYYHGWGKVRDLNSCVEPKENLYKDNGVWIDIYKLVKCDENNIDYEKKQEHLDYINRRYYAGGFSKKERDERIQIAGLNLINSNIDTNEESGKEVFLIMSASGISVEKDWCKDSEKICFENRKLKTFLKYDKYLERHYGSNYMMLPDEMDRYVGICKVQII